MDNNLGTTDVVRLKLVGSNASGNAYVGGYTDSSNFQTAMQYKLRWPEALIPMSSK